MPLQIVQKGGEAKYNPNRDMVYALPAIIQTAVENALDLKPIPELTKWLAEHAIADTEIAEGFAAYIAFMMKAKDSHGKKMTQAMDESGWLDVRWAVKVVVMFNISYVLSGTFFHGARVAVDEEHCIPTMPALIEAGRQLDEYARMSWWQKWKYRRKRDRLPIVNVR